MSFMPILLFLCSFSFLSFGIFILVNSKEKLVIKVFNIFVFSFALWSFGLGMYYFVKDLQAALFWAKFLYFCASLIPPSFLVFSYVFPKFESGKLKSRFYLFIPNILLFVLYFFTPLLLKEIRVEEGIKIFVYGKLRYLWDIQFNGILTFGFIRYFRLFLNSKGLIRENLKYLIAGDLYIYIFAGTTNVLLPLLGIYKYIWMGPLISIFWIFIISYTIVKYRLMDIRLAISNMAIFVAVYTLVLGAPFYTYALGHHLAALISMLVLATLGPVIFVHLRRQAEDKILETQKRYRIALDSASKGVKRFRTVDEIIEHISIIIYKSIGLKNVAFYLKEGEKLFLKKTDTNSEGYQNEINNNELIEYFISKNQPILIKEMHQERHKSNHSKNGVINESLTEVAVPLVQENRLVGLILLGDKKDFSLFSELDFNTLNQISDRVALAVEHALYLEAEKKRNEDENKDKRQFQLDRFASSMAHQIRNPLNIIYATLQTNDDLLAQVETKIDGDFYTSLIKENSEAKACCERITRTIKTILDFGRGRIDLRKIKINELLEGFDILNKLIIKKYGVDLKVDAHSNLPEIQGDVHLIEEALIIYLDNSCQAVSKDNCPKTVIFQVSQINDDYIRCKISDQGHGISEETQKVLFDVSTSTKGTEGNGLGLWRVRKICEIMEGSKYGFYSAGRGQGASFWIDLKIATKQ
jgi:K+-sensing histidine kinase KdpD